MILIAKLYYEENPFFVPFECDSVEQAVEIFLERKEAATTAWNKFREKIFNSEFSLQDDCASGEFMFAGHRLDIDSEVPSIITLEEWLKENMENL